MSPSTKFAAVLAAAALALPAAGAAHADSAPADPPMPAANGSCTGGDITWTATPGVGLTSKPVKSKGFGSLTGCSGVGMPMKSGTLEYEQDATASCLSGFSGPSKAKITWDNKMVSYAEIPSWTLPSTGDATLTGRFAKGALEGATFSIHVTYDGVTVSNAAKCLTPEGLDSGNAKVVSATIITP
ncbi:hypothetical protein [Streptomyces sp. NBC_01304]|uniref:hypothetical protein n=1 Tax=Streptomyces sp. NBC_01304 TaxID=2903818 RepID=UPI002E11EB59|nr:hypothetical protein OG430_46305 [Streptomyces sp. NBC_01304]